MQCDDIQVDLTAYLHGTVPPDRRAVIESHIASCQMCAEEAAAMREIGRRLSRGLKEWADQGVCPPDVLASIEHGLRAERRQPWWQRWPTYAGAVAAAVLLLVVFASRSTELTHQVASIPFVGTLAAQLLYPGADVRVDDIPDPQASEVLAADTHDGITLAVYAVSTGPKATQIKYALRGTDLDTDEPMNRYAPRLTGNRGALKLTNLRIQRANGEVLVTAEFEPVLPGQEVALAVTVPQKEGLTWQVRVKP